MNEAHKHGAIGCLSADEELQQAVCAALIEAAELDSGTLAVRAENGTVVLTGSVRSRRDWLQAQRIAREQPGVSMVQAAHLSIDDA
ncbi:MAG TPA: BON domain-containing protein [Polyangiaceae bacterium]|nr:BON domain-containing protein [Polyangiaceae bacterium]